MISRILGYRYNQDEIIGSRYTVTVSVNFPRVPCFYMGVSQPKNLGTDVWMGFENIPHSYIGLC